MLVRIGDEEFISLGNGIFKSKVTGKKYRARIAAIDNGFSMPIKSGKDDPRSIILSRFAYRIWGKRIPKMFLERIELLKDPKFQNHIKNLLEPKAFQLFNERIEQLLDTGIAKVDKYRVVEKIRGIPKKKGE